MMDEQDGRHASLHFVQGLYISSLSLTEVHVIVVPSGPCITAGVQFPLMFTRCGILDLSYEKNTLAFHGSMSPSPSRLAQNMSINSIDIGTHQPDTLIPKKLYFSHQQLSLTFSRFILFLFFNLIHDHGHHHSRKVDSWLNHLSDR